MNFWIKCGFLAHRDLTRKSLIFQNELELAVSFYLTTLALQSTFEPARDRLVSITCEHRDIMKKLEMNAKTKEENDAT